MVYTKVNTLTPGNVLVNVAIEFCSEAVLYCLTSQKIAKSYSIGFC